MSIRQRLTDSCQRFPIGGGKMDCICTLRLTPEEWKAEGADDDKREEKVEKEASLGCLSACDGHKCKVSITPIDDGGRQIIAKCIVTDPTANVILSADA